MVAKRFNLLLTIKMGKMIYNTPLRQLYMTKKAFLGMEYVGSPGSSTSTGQSPIGLLVGERGSKNISMVFRANQVFEPQKKPSLCVRGSVPTITSFSGR